MQKPDLIDIVQHREEQSLLLPGITVEVFADYPHTLQILRRAQRNRAFTRMKWRFNEGGISKALETFQVKPSPNLIILESDEDREHLLPMLVALSELCGEDTRVLMIGAGDDDAVALFRSVLKLGVSDYLQAPVDCLQVVNAVIDIFKDDSDLKLGRSTAFMGAGGGTGSSTIAQSVAAAMARLTSADVLLADLDPQFGTVALNFEAEDAYSLTDVLRRGAELDEVLIQRITRQVEPTLGLLTVEPSIDNLPNMPTPAINAILDISNSMPKHILLDMTHVWSLRTKRIVCRVDQVVITTMPTLAGLRNARDLMRVLKRIRPTDSLPIIVLNKIGVPRREEMSPLQFREALELEEIFCIPYDAKLFSRAQTRGSPVVNIDEHSKISIQLIRLARMLSGDTTAADPRPISERIFARLRRWW